MSEPIPIIIHCPECGVRHIDVGEFATKPHHTHACQNCGMVWRPALVHTVGVQFLPGFKNVVGCGGPPGGVGTCDCNPLGECPWRDTSSVTFHE